MKVLYIDPFVHTSYSRIYKHYDYLYDELRKICKCYLYKKKDFKELNKVLKECSNKGFYPDIIFFGMGWFNLDEENFSQLDLTNNISVPIVGYFYKAQNLLVQKLNFIKSNNFDLMMSAPPKCKEYENITGIPFKLCPHAADSNTFYDRKIKKQFDVGYSGALHDNKLYVEGSFKTFNIRRRAQELLAEQKNIKSFLNGSDHISQRINSYHEYARKINQCKIWLATPAPQEEIVSRYFEIGMSGTLLFCSEIPFEYRSILQNKKNCIEFKNDLSDFLDKFYFCLNNWLECQEIIKNTYCEFHANHSWFARAKSLKNEFEKLLRNKINKTIKL